MLIRIRYGHDIYLEGGSPNKPYHRTLPIQRVNMNDAISLYLKSTYLYVDTYIYIHKLIEHSKSLY